VSGGAARVAAQAKVNLFLRILAREASGYHQIETLFCRVALADDVVVRLATRGRTLDCRGADVGPVDENLAFRAARAYADARSGWPRGFAIEIEKRIPVGAGLGGGSADAGAVLRALRALDPSPLPPDGILALARTLGADVPVMTIEEPLALAWGRGDRLLPMPPLPARPVLLALPAVAIATRDAYAWLAPPSAGAQRLPTGGFRDWRAVEPWLGNDFERVVVARHPEIGAVLAAVRDLPGVRPETALMSGSGSALYALLDAAPAAALPAAVGGARLLATSTVAHVDAVERIA
jgi:4-diphosphocytidyl-2-C-methyl-D-erythritol kinase